MPTKANIQDETAILDWLANGETGLSSETMAFTALGVHREKPRHPLDPDDLTRCVKLLVRCPSVRDAFPQIAALSAQWAALIGEWDEIVALLLSEVPTLRGRAPRTYQRMKELGL